MTRSLHSDPAVIRAERRTLAPRGSRASSAAARRRRARLLRSIGLPATGPADRPADPIRPIRIRVTRARPGYAHPLSRRRIAEALEFFGPLATYGLRSVELRQAEDEPGGALTLARLIVPGVVILYEQRVPPWRFERPLSGRALGRLTAAGALVRDEPSPTTVEWPDDTLADLMLFDGLMHEIGHHLVQHHHGKRGDRVVRTADHENATARFVARCRTEWATRPASG